MGPRSRAARGDLREACLFQFLSGQESGCLRRCGAIVTNDESLAVRCRMIADHGRVNKYDHDIEGMNSRLDGLQGAILSVKLHHLDAWTERRRSRAALYDGLLRDSGVATPAVAPGDAARLSPLCRFACRIATSYRPP